MSSKQLKTVLTTQTPGKKKIHYLSAADWTSGNDCQLHTRVPVLGLAKCCDQERNKSGSPPQLAAAVCAAVFKDRRKKEKKKKMTIQIYTWATRPLITSINTSKEQGVKRQGRHLRGLPVSFFKWPFRRSTRNLGGGARRWPCAGRGGRRWARAASLARVHLTPSGSGIAPD